MRSSDCDPADQVRANTKSHRCRGARAYCNQRAHCIETGVCGDDAALVTDAFEGEVHSEVRRSEGFDGGGGFCWRGVR